MPSVVRLSEARTIPATVERACDAVLETPLPEVFRHRYGVFPAITEVRDHDGEWDRAGLTRTVVLSSGATMRETLTHVARPYFVEFTLADLEGRMAAVVASVEGHWLFEPVGTGVQISLAWNVHPASRWSLLAMPLFQLFWHGYARSAFDEIESILLA